MPMAIGVRFRNAGKLYYFNPGTLWPSAGNAVIVETARGVEYAEVVVGVHEILENGDLPPLKKVLRIATPDDAAQENANREMEQAAYEICQRKILEHRLEMKLVSVEYTFDLFKLIAYFTANGRVDFRALVKDLASTFRTRIELKQIGVRDEAKILGGLGPCGRPICCAQFLGDFQPVSIKMAKEQNLSLNPTKISGICGRLMCCLKFEEEQYEKARKALPRIGKEVLTPDGRGVVTDLNILKESLRVRIVKGESADIREYAARDVQRLTPPQDETPLQPGRQGRAKTAFPPAGAGKAHFASPGAYDAAGILDEEFIETPIEIVHTDEGIADD